MKIAYLISLDKKFKSGLYYSIILKINSFIENNPDFEVDVYNIDVRHPHLVRKIFEVFKVHPKKEFQDTINFDGLICKNLYFNYNIFSYLRMKFNYKFDFYKLYAKINVKHIHNKYDLISAHYTGPVLAAYNMNLLTNIPFTLTFHGTDMNVWSV